MAKRYYWLKLKENFFNTPHLKAMRKLPGGTELCIIYLKMMLQSIKNEGVLLHTLETNSFADELSLILDENSQSIDMVLHFLTKNHLIEQIEDDTFLLPEAKKCIGSESESTERVRKYREKDKELQICQNSETLHCNNNVTALHCNTDIDIDNNNNSNNININKEELILVINVLKEIDIQESVAAELYKKYGKETIFLALADMKNRKGINRPGGYLIKMLQEKWPISKNTIEEIKNIKKQKQREELKHYKEEAAKFCLSCDKQNEKDLICSHDGMRLDRETLKEVKCEFCIIKEKSK